MLPEASTGAVLGFHLKVIFLIPPSLLSDLWFLVGIALQKVKRTPKQQIRAWLCRALLNEAKVERKEPGSEEVLLVQILRQCPSLLWEGVQALGVLSRGGPEESAAVMGRLFSPFLPGCDSEWLVLTTSRAGEFSH